MPALIEPRYRQPRLNVERTPKLVRISSMPEIIENFELFSNQWYRSRSQIEIEKSQYIKRINYQKSISRIKIDESN